MSRTYARTLHHLPPDTAEAWLFESAAARRQAEAEWAAQGRNIRLHSAYKSLLHHVLEIVLEEPSTDDSETLLIRYPVIPGDEPQRFRLECYPITGLWRGEVQFEAVEQCFEAGGDKLPFYEVVTTTATQRIPVPVRWVNHPCGKPRLVACGWIINQHGEGLHLNTEFEQIYRDACQYFATMPLEPIHASQPTGPFFHRLSLHIGLPVADVKLPVAEECISLTEAMHEDIYFSATEIFQQRLGLAPQDRSLMPGQVVPEVVYQAQPSLHISLEDCHPDEEDDTALKVGLHQLEHWLTPHQITTELAQLGGQPFSVTSRQGRPVKGCAIVNGSAVKLAISGGQHANESSGVVGALRAAHTLKARGDVDFTVCPSENPDGYALFRQLCQTNPTHMHHAARYTSAGNDLSYGTDYESLIRGVAKQHLFADVHVNLHGYPSHEWTRPLSGYVPEGFATWTIPKGFFLICRYNPGYQAQAEVILQAAIQAIADFDEQRQQNLSMLERYVAAVESGGFRIAQGVVPYMITEYERTDYPIEIITEAPDETVYGEAFRVAHESHYRVILAIVGAIPGCRNQG